MKRALPLLLIVLIAVLTPVLSTALFFIWRPEGQVNLGTVLPPQAVETRGWQTAAGDAFDVAQWRGDWVLLAGGAGACDAQCQRQLCQMRQLRLMLPGHYLRLRRAWLSTDRTAPPTALMAQTDCGELQGQGQEDAAQTIKQVDVMEGVEVLHAPAAALPAGTADVYLVDPGGVWVMRFPPHLSIYDMRKDLKRLLRISKGRRQIES